MWIYARVGRISWRISWWIYRRVSRMETRTIKYRGPAKLGNATRINDRNNKIDR